MRDTNGVRLEFHISRQARDRYQFDESLFSLSGNLLFANFYAARIFAQKMNEKRDLVSFPEQAVRAGQINAMGLIDEVSHQVVQLYREQKNPRVMQAALDWLVEHLGREAVDSALSRFADQFPPLAVYRLEMSVQVYLEGETAGVAHRQILLEEMLMLWLANVNPAFAPFLELFDDAALSRQTAYPQIMSSLYDFFETQPSFGPDKQNLIDMLRSPARAHPHSLSAQLEYLRERWRLLLSRYLYRLLSSLDLIQEEQKAIFFGPGPSLVYEFGELELEPERFSPDLDWMPRLVLMAKNTYVWLHQLSQKHKRLITHLDQIPDEELDILARWGFTGLWLIGVWERSPASRKIKQLCGNPEAVSSAYSLYDYQIASDLGGEAAYQNLRERAWRRGIRLASDMVPNHVGTYSRWVVEHPDWFISLDHSPFPSYHFDGPDLSDDQRVGIFVEDRYYDRSDAAVVFKRVDCWTGNERFIYHGNDGTSMPWNDTAQLDYLNPQVREAVIQAILRMARQFPIIRFDAAMTLTKKHYQRLWFPEPGTGGAIPTRAEHGLTKEQFDAAMPIEFWREVVDRVAAEAPDTLLLAEAFWLMEGYFVRTLGMHRVYNSAFMHMLRDEDNAKYRTVIKNTLEFDPEILRRFVNFMNNPDEETAVAQFGKGDKYLGICTMMVTLPGLPMFGHGQVEGLAEKYGMEYRRAYWDEQPDGYLVERHEREIFPLLHRRYLFAEAEHFLLYDLFTPEGFVDENVFAYSNRATNPLTGANERALVLYHNKFATARGWIKSSVAYLGKASKGERVLVQKTLGEGLGLNTGESFFCIFRDQVTDLEYIRNSRDLHENGLYVELDAYERQVFVDWREIEDNDWHQYGHLAAFLDGRGVPSIEEASHEMFLQPIHGPFRELVNAGAFGRLMDKRVIGPGVLLDREFTAELDSKALDLLRAIEQFIGGSGDDGDAAPVIAREIRHELEICLQLPVLQNRLPQPRSPQYDDAVGVVQSHLGDEPAAWATLFGWLFTHGLGQLLSREGAAERGRSWLDEWLLGKLLAGTLRDLGVDEGAARWAVGLVKLLVRHQGWYEQAVQPEDRWSPDQGQHSRRSEGLAEPATAESPQKEQAHRILASWLQDNEVQHALGVNRHGGVLWFNREAFEQLLRWMLTIAVVEIGPGLEPLPEKAAGQIVACYQVVTRLQQAQEASGYQVVKLLEVVRG